MLRGSHDFTQDHDTAVARTLRTIAIAAAAILLAWLLSDVLLLILLAALIATVLRGVTEWGARHTGISEPVVLTLVITLAFVLFAGFTYYIVPNLFSQTQDLMGQLKQEEQSLRQTYGHTAWGQLLLNQSSPSQLLHDHVFGYARTAATSTISGFVTGFILVITSIYFAASPGLYINGTLRLVPTAYRNRARRLQRQLGRTLQWWFLGQSIDMLAVGILTGLGLLLLGIPLALALAFIAGLFTFIPYFGTIAAAIPAIIVALTVSWQSALWVGVIFLGCHMIEGYLIAPFVQRRTVHLPPAITILSMTILGTIFGPLGIILGAPVAATIIVVVREVYVVQILGDTEAEGDEAEL